MIKTIMSKEQFAKYLGVNISTLSRWISRKTYISRVYFNKCYYYGETIMACKY